MTLGRWEEALKRLLEQRGLPEEQVNIALDLMYRTERDARRATLITVEQVMRRAFDAIRETFISDGSVSQLLEAIDGAERGAILQGFREADQLRRVTREERDARLATFRSMAPELVDTSADPTVGIDMEHTLEDPPSG